MMLPERKQKLKQERMAAVAKAEKADGYREGTFRHTFDGTLCRVEVSFYPRRKWFVSVIDAKGNEVDRKPLTVSLWSRLEPAIKL